jgi:hypothetical protein
MVNITLYVEGGGDTRGQQAPCRKGFSSFLEKTGFKGRMPKIVACGGRANAFSNFKTAIKDRAPNALALLLVDSEEGVNGNEPWLHVKQRIGDEWPRPMGAKHEQLHFMVRTMEAWFHSDLEVLEEYFKPGFRRNAMSPNPKVESIPKKDLYQGLKAATEKAKKGAYSKGEHSFAILALIDPRKVRSSSPWADRFLTHLEAVTQR